MFPFVSSVRLAYKFAPAREDGIVDAQFQVFYGPTGAEISATRAVRFCTAMSQPLIELNNVEVAFNGVTVLHEITWQLFPGQQWAIVGDNGSGKSSFLKLIRGELSPVPGR